MFSWLFMNSVGVLRTYLRNHFYENISCENLCPSHCNQWSLNDATNLSAKQPVKGSANFFCRPCNHKHEEICDYCSIMLDLFKVLTGMIHTYGTSFSQKERNIMYFEAKHSMDSIYSYQQHLQQGWSEICCWQECFL